MAESKSKAVVKPTAIYVRVSSRKQTERSQLPALKKWEQGLGVKAVWYWDKFTGTSMERPGFDRLLDDVRAGKVGTIVVWRLDRLGRTMGKLVMLYEDLQALGVSLISLTERFDLFGPAGKIIYAVTMAYAELENEVRTERVMAGQAAARAEGKRWGGSPKGYRYKVNAEQFRVVKRLKAEGASVSAIARATSLSRPTVYSIIADLGESPRSMSEVLASLPRSQSGIARAKPPSSPSASS